MVVDALEVLAADLVERDLLVRVQHHGEVADDVLDELGVLVGLLGHPLLVGAVERRKDVAGRGLLQDVHELLDPQVALEADLGLDAAAWVSHILADFLAARA